MFVPQVNVQLGGRLSTLSSLWWFVALLIVLIDTFHPSQSFTQSQVSRRVQLMVYLNDALAFFLGFTWK